MRLRCRTKHSDISISWLVYVQSAKSTYATYLGDRDYISVQELLLTVYAQMVYTCVLNF